MKRKCFFILYPGEYAVGYYFGVGDNFKKQKSNALFKAIKDVIKNTSLDFSEAVVGIKAFRCGLMDLLSKKEDVCLFKADFKYGKTGNKIVDDCLLFFKDGEPAYSPSRKSLSVYENIDLIGV